MVKQPVIVLTGPTASGKTKLAANLANLINAEIISADSRQIFIGMDIGTGKDLSDYNINNNIIKTHLIDIKQIGEDFSVWEFQETAEKILSNINNDKYSIICGGTAFYIKALIKNYEYTQIPPNKELRSLLEYKSINELITIFNKTKSIYTNLADTSTKRRLIRSIEIAQFLSYKNNIKINDINKKHTFKVFAINVDKETRRKLILERLNFRLGTGLIEEVAYLLKTNSHNTIINYGLEYKYISLYLLGKINHKEMHEQLYIQICRYAKRQMTFLRHLEKSSIKITWIPYECNLNNKMTFITSLL
ncbi:MAG: tRNA (adenosine(37)-N6)-dimethylallyltransferase MiaA [Solitalea-like symbiont of Acarus siro]